MAYTTVNELKLYIPSEVLLQITDDNSTDSIDQEKIQYCIRQADDLIDGYLRGRYPVPLTTVPAMISDVSVKLAVYFLFKRALILTMPETITADYNDGMAILRDIQKGRISPFEVLSNPTWFVNNKKGSVSVLNQATNYGNDILIRSQGSNTRFLNPGL